MTDTRTLIERLEALDREATPGPWFTLDAPWLPGGSETSILAGSPDPHVATFICDFDMWAIDDEDDRKSDNSDADAAAIVTLRNALPEIITALHEREGGDRFPKPRRNDGGEPCGECNLKEGETCDICGAFSPGPGSVEWLKRSPNFHPGDIA